MPDSTQNMAITSIIKEAQTKEKITTAPSRKSSIKKAKKKPRLEESTQEFGSNECPPLIRFKPDKDPITTFTYSSLVPSLPKISILPIEPPIKQTPHYIYLILQT